VYACARAGQEAVAGQAPTTCKLAPTVETASLGASPPSATGPPGDLVLHPQLNCVVEEGGIWSFLSFSLKCTQRSPARTSYFRTYLGYLHKPSDFIGRKGEKPTTKA